MTLVALLEVVTITWLYGGHMLDEAMLSMTGRKVPHVFRVLCAFVTPVVMMV